MFASFMMQTCKHAQPLSSTQTKKHTEVTQYYQCGRTYGPYVLYIQFGTSEHVPLHGSHAENHKYCIILPVQTLNSYSR